MIDSVLLDTTFLISLVDNTREHHQKAKDFYKYFLDKKHPMILSSIATAEFCIKQPLTDLPLANFKLLPFNIPDSHHLSKLFETYFKGKTSSRVAVKDDFKLVSQADFNKIRYFITEDDELINKVLSPLINDNKISVKPIYLPDGVNVAFSIPVGLFGDEVFKINSTK